MEPEQSSATIDLRLLGPFTLGTGLRLPTRKSEALLAYLAMPAGRPHRRDSLIGLLWGDRGEKQARHSLSQTLFSLRKALADGDGEAPCLVVDGDSVMLDPSLASVDVAEFERLGTQSTAEALSAAAGLYRGELLQGLHLRELAFQDWLATERSRIRETAVGVFHRLMHVQERAGDLEAAVQAAVRLLAIDPLQESVHRSLMKLHLAQDRPAAALRQYEMCAEILRRELDEEPEAETKRLRNEIAQHRSRRRAQPEPPNLRPSPPSTVQPAAKSVNPPPIGREDEFSRLRAWLHEANQGTSRLVFVCGEAGIGKTSLISALTDAAGSEGIRTGCGQCIDHRGAGEPYLPILQAVSELCRTPGEFRACIEAYAPTWLAQLPALATVGAGGWAPPVATPERMLREMVEALEAAADRETLLLILEDLHWSDRSTLDLLEALAHRRQPARLMVVGTYRLADATSNIQPVYSLARMLRVRGLSEEIHLDALSEAAVERHLVGRFPGGPLPDGLASVLRARSGGNPLFMQNLLDWWLDNGKLIVEGVALRVANDDLAALEAGVPDNLAFLIEQQLERLPDLGRNILEAASVVGDEFPAAAVAAALEVAEDEVEASLVELARQRVFVSQKGTVDWPDGTMSSSFSFLHQLYREGLYARLPAGRRMRLHRRIGDRLEAAFAGSDSPPLTELAMHFLHGRDAPRAVGYLDKAARQAMQRSAQRDAVGLLEQARNLLPMLDESERRQAELSVCSVLGPALVVAGGWSAPGAETTYRRTLELAEQLGDRRRRSSAMFGLATLLEFRARFSETQALLEERLQMLRHDTDVSALVESEELMACSKFHHASFALAVAHADNGLSAYDSGRDRMITACLGDNPAISCLHWGARALWFLGRPEEALARAQKAQNLASSEGYTFALAISHEQMARLHQHRGEPQAALDHAIRAVTLAEEFGFAYRRTAGTILRGWSRAVLGDPESGLADIRDGLRRCDEMGAALERPYFGALMAEVLMLLDRRDEADDVLGEALSGARRSNGFFYEAEILRLRGRLALNNDPEDADGTAEAALKEALADSRRRQSLMVAMRTAGDLASLWERQGRPEAAAELLADIDGDFSDCAASQDFQTFDDLRRRMSPRRGRRAGKPDLRAGRNY